MKYRVEWTLSAERRLAELWNDAGGRSEITKAADEIDAALSRNPAAFGESHGDDTRIGFSRPLGVFFDVDDISMTVKVWRVWRFR
jgi:hypothetical protein